MLYLWCIMLKKIRHIGITALLFTAIIPQNLTSQEKHKLSIKERLTYKQGNDAFQILDYDLAFSFYEELHEKHKNWTELNYKMGVCIVESSHDINRAKDYFKQINDYTPAYFFKGLMAHNQLKFKQALSFFEKSQADQIISTQRIEKAKKATLYAQKAYENPTKDKLITINQLNSIYDDYAPIIDANAQRLLFTSRRDTSSKPDLTKRYNEDIFQAIPQGESWSIPEKLNLNNEQNNATAGLSPDGKTLVLFNQESNEITGNLYFSSRTTDGWTTPSKYDSQINSEYIESSASFSPAGDLIYFSSDRPGGLGGKDIYRIRKLSNGIWSKPYNLGPAINTPYDDDAPFIHPNGRTLYFCSKGHKNMGQYDIFSSELSLDELNWSEPKNLGYPINSVENDLFFSVNATGTEAFFSSKRPNSIGGQDIYKVDLIEKPTAYVVGYVKDAQTKKPIKATLTLKDKQDNIIGIYKSSRRTGKYILVPNYNQAYTLKISHPKYKKITQRLVIDATKGFDGEFFLEAR